MSVSKALERKVRSRAKERCEYCKIHQSLQGASFHMEHIIPLSLGGTTDSLNLVLACPSCNLHKSNRIEAPDPVTESSHKLFHPLIDKWIEHFRFDGFHIIGVSSIGRATAAALCFNHPRRIKIREAESTFDLFPPPKS